MASIPGLFQIASFAMQVGAAYPLQQSLDITGRTTMQVDRIQAYLRVEPNATGDIPALADLQLAERLIRVRIALDRNDVRVLTNGDVPVSVFQQLDGGPLPVPPFQLGGNETPTLKINYGSNFLLMPAIAKYGSVFLEVVFYGQEV
jgi:hypothetical protein